MPATQAKQKLHAAMKQGLMNFIEAAKPHRRPSLHLVPPMPGPIAPVATAAPGAPAVERSFDPVALTVLAVNRLGPATLRTATHGKSWTVAVPDDRTAEIFRAALKQMQKARRTDRLIDIIVTGDLGVGSGGRDAGEA